MSETNSHQIAEQLAAPFDAAEIRWKPQAVSGNRALAIPYLHARAEMDRLDDVCGVDGWEDAYDILPHRGQRAVRADPGEVDARAHPLENRLALNMVDQIIALNLIGQDGITGHIGKNVFDQVVPELLSLADRMPFVVVEIARRCH
jgi:hypothetical protein